MLRDAAWQEGDVKTVALQEMAVGEEAGEIALHYSIFESNDNVGAASLNANYDPGANAQQTMVRIVTGDDYCVKGDLPAPDIIKIDVEGFERPALAGLSKTIGE